MVRLMLASFQRKEARYEQMNWQIEFSLLLACQHDNWDCACGLRLILGEIGHHGYPVGVELIPFRAFYNGSSGLKGFGSDLNGDIGMGDDIVIPIRMGWRAGFGRDDDQALTISCVCQRVDTLLAALRAHCGKQDQRRSCIRSTNLAFVRMKFLYNLAIPSLIIVHHSSLCSCQSHDQQYFT